MLTLENTNNYLRAYLSLIKYRIDNDINELKNQIVDINEKIKEKEGSKLSLNFMRNSNVKSLQEEVEFKENYLKEAIENASYYNIDISSLDNNSFKDFINELYLKDTTYLNRYGLLLQILYTPLYLDFEKEKFTYDEVSRDFSLSGICTYLGFNSKHFEKIEDETKLVSKLVSLNYNNILRHITYKNKDYLNNLCPFSYLILNIKGEKSKNFLQDTFNIGGLNLNGLFSLENINEINPSVINSSLDGSLEQINLDSLTSYFFNIVLYIRFSMYKCEEGLKIFRQNILQSYEIFITSYHKKVLLGELLLDDIKLENERLDAINNINHVILAELSKVKE